MNTEPEMETMREIWPAGGDAAHYHWEVGPDRDGMGCVEIRYIEEDEKGRKIRDRLTFNPAVAALIAQAIQKSAQELTP